MTDIQGAQNDKKVQSAQNDKKVLRMTKTNSLSRRKQIVVSPSFFIVIPAEAGIHNLYCWMLDRCPA
jgi:hypothetical protein